METTPEALEVLAASLEPTDRVALEVTGGSWEVARILEPHVQRVVVVCPDDTGIAQARAKTDKLDAGRLAKLLWQGELDAVWMPDERCRVLRRRLARREQLVRSRSRCKNEIHAVLMRRLQGKPPCSDLFGVKGRKWLRSLQLPVEEAETVQAALRHIAFLDPEIAEVERLIAKRDALLAGGPAADDRAGREPDLRRDVPGRDRRHPPVLQLAASWSPISDWTRGCASPASSPPAAGRISKRGSASARWALVEAAWSVVHQPGPLHAFYLRIARAPRARQSDRRGRAQSSRSCSGACSPAARTTPTSSRR